MNISLTAAKYATDTEWVYSQQIIYASFVLEKDEHLSPTDPLIKALRLPPAAATNISVPHHQTLRRDLRNFWHIMVLSSGNYFVFALAGPFSPHPIRDQICISSNFHLPIWARAYCLRIFPTPENISYYFRSGPGCSCLAV